MKNVRKQYHSNKNYTYCRLIGQGYSLLTVLNQLQIAVTPPKGVNPVTLSYRTLSTSRSLCYSVSSRTLSTIRSLCYPVSSRTLSTIRSLCYPVSSHTLSKIRSPCHSVPSHTLSTSCSLCYPVFSLTLSSVNTVLTMLFSQNEVSCHSCQPWSSRNSLVHREVTLNVKNDSK